MRNSIDNSYGDTYGLLGRRWSEDDLFARIDLVEADSQTSPAGAPPRLSARGDVPHISIGSPHDTHGVDSDQPRLEQHHWRVQAMVFFALFKRFCSQIGANGLNFCFMLILVSLMLGPAFLVVFLVLFFIVVLISILVVQSALSAHRIRAVNGEDQIMNEMNRHHFEVRRDVEMNLRSQGFNHAEIRSFFADRNFTARDYETLVALDAMNVSRFNGLSVDEIARLPTFTIVQPRHDEPACAVCLDVPQSGDTLLSLPCFHRYHADCIKRWLRDKGECPVCHYEINFD